MQPFIDGGAFQRLFKLPRQQEDAALMYILGELACFALVQSDCIDDMVQAGLIPWALAAFENPDKKQSLLCCRLLTKVLTNTSSVLGGDRKHRSAVFEAGGLEFFLRVYDLHPSIEVSSYTLAGILFLISETSYPKLMDLGVVGRIVKAVQTFSTEECICQTALESFYLLLYTGGEEAREKILAAGGLVACVAMAPYGTVSDCVMKTEVIDMFTQGDADMLAAARTAYCAAVLCQLPEVDGAAAECPVCLAQMSGVARALPCNHVFCQPCIEAHLTTAPSPSCPVCRGAVICA